MSTNAPTLTREQWRTVLDDTDRPTFGELVSTIEAATMIDAEGPAAEQLVDGAVGDLLEADPEASGMFDVFRLADRDGHAAGVNQQSSTNDPEVLVKDASDGVGVGAGEGSESASTDTDNRRNPGQYIPSIEAGVFPEDLVDVEQWLTWKETDDGRKVPRAPYEHPDWPDKYVSAQNPDVWRDFETVAEWCDKVPGFEPAFNIRDREEHPNETHVLVDYDDVRDPETGEVHPIVREHVDRAASYADISTSGTGVHIFCQGSLPDGVKAIEAHLPEVDEFPGAEIEVYQSARFSAMTGDHLAGTPRRTAPCQALLEDLADEFATVAEGTPDDLLQEPETSKADLADVETTDDIQDVLDAIQHTGPRDIRLRSTVTHDRGDGTKSMDPSWATSKSGTRLAQVDDGWVYRKGMAGLDALQVVALEESIIHSEREYPSGEDFWRAVEALRDRGAHIPEFEPPENDADHTAVLPETERLEEATSGWDWRHAGAEAEREFTIDDARERTVDAIADAYESGDRVLVEALPTMGKSFGAVKAAAETDTEIAILTGRGRKEQYDQFLEWCDEHGLTANVLPSFMEECATANGEHGEEWAEEVRDWYRRGATPKQIHAYAESELGRPLPCQAHEGQECPYTSAWRGAYEDANGDAYDVLIGHYNHAHLQEVTEGRVAVFDEFPDAYESMLGGQLQGAVSYWLSTVDAIPFDDYTDLVENRSDQRRRADALLWFEDHGLEPDETHVFDDGAAHAAAPLAAFTLLASDDLGNGFEMAALDDVGTGVFDRKTGEVSLLRPPSLKYDTGVVALDGTPTKEMWELSLGTRLNHRPVLQPEERAEYLQEALNLNLVRTTDAVKPYNSPDHVNVEQDAALLEGIVDAHGEAPALITTSTARDEYDAADLLNVDPKTGDVSAGPAQSVKWYGNVLGSNEYKETRVGAVIGSNHYGDRYIQKWGALAGEAVERNSEKGAGLSYGEFGDKVLAHMREHDTLQAAMRFGRDGNGAVVYVHTDTLPEWVPLAGEGRIVTTWSDGMKGILEALDDVETATTAEIVAHPAVGVGRRQVLAHLETLRERGVLSREQDPNDGRRVRWTDDGLHRVNDHGDVELEPVELDDLTEDEVAELARSSIYTWEFRNRGGGSPESGGRTCPEVSTSSHAVATGDPPPDPTD